MGARDEVEKFLTLEGRAKVKAFAADCADGSDDVDMDEVVRQNLADHEAALSGGQARKVPPSPPKPTVGFIVVNADWDPKRTPAAGWTLLTLPQAKVEQAAFAAMDPDGDGKVILQATTTYRIVDGGSRG